MYRHYQGNSGKSRKVAEPERVSGSFHGKKLAPVPPKPQEKKQIKAAGKNMKATPPSPLSGLSGELGKLFGKLGSISLETEDLLLIAVLYLMYRESGDSELLIMIGALLLF